MMTHVGRNIGKMAGLCTSAILLYGAVMEFYGIAWGTGTWYGEFSLKWGTAFVLLATGCVALLAIWALHLWRGDDTLRVPWQRNHLIAARCLFGVIVVAVPIGLLQYSPWGAVIEGPFLRLLLWAMCVVILSLVVAPEAGQPLTFTNIIPAILVSGALFVAAAAVTEVTDYPFSLGWSEGNRIWDYSLLFGHRLYSLGHNQAPTAYLDLGRQLVGGIPFILPGISILGERLWLAVVGIVPCLLVGLFAFWPRVRGRSTSWILAGLFGLVFLSQGPIHAPLLISAILVAASWRLSLRWAVPLIAVAGYFAAMSRFTWMFGPAIWALMLEVSGAEAGPRGVRAESWRRGLTLGAAGMLGSLVALSGLFAFGATSVESSANVSTSQALLWYRLLPNATYGDGILLGLVKAAVPLIAVLIYTGMRYWRARLVQVLILIGTLGAFLVVGLVVSTKIGGGGDLHNLDMFLIGLVFSAGILWKAAGRQWVDDLGHFPFFMQAVIGLMLIMPAYGPLRSLRPIAFAPEAEWISVLADVEQPRDLGSLPDNATVEASLEQLRKAVELADQHGEVLFMDQRQLLTFGFIRDIELISDYEKKRMMDEALSANAAYFEPFYRDLAARRFALVVSSPLRTPIKDSEYGFGEENNAWVRWVARPILCYYEEQDTLNEVKVQLLVPRTGPVDCSAVLPRAD